MSLQHDLENSKTEEDVKDAYIRALGLKRYTKGLVDIQSEEIWFEAKAVSTPPVIMFGQLLCYVRAARKKGEKIPAFLGVFDRENAALIPTELVIPVLNDKSITWPKAGSQAGKSLAVQVAPYIEAHFIVYNIHINEKELKAAVNSILDKGEIIRTAISPSNLRKVFDNWVSLVGSELIDVKESDLAVLFYADIMHDGKKPAVKDLPAKLLHEGDKPVFYFNGKTYELSSLHGYRAFWAVYHRPPETEHRQYLLERRDSLLPIDERSFKGAFYTPLKIVDKVYDALKAELGPTWQEDYMVWDMCCGVGNLEVRHSNYRNIFMSTLDQVDLDVMRAGSTCIGANMFQYDYLNDDVTADGAINYEISRKVPETLRKVISGLNSKSKDSKKLLVLINPPYAEATSGGNTLGKVEVGLSKEGVASTKVAAHLMDEFGKASNDLYLQFLCRIYKEIPGAKIALISKVKHICAPTLDQFRVNWKAKFESGFVFNSKLFDGIKGSFPIAFTVWTIDGNTIVDSIKIPVIDQHMQVIGTKVFSTYDNMGLLTDWIDRPKCNGIPAVPLKNAIVAATAKKDLRGKEWSDNAVGWFNCAGNDYQNAISKTMILSSGYGSARGLFITKDNVDKVATAFAVRRLVDINWLTDRDQFLSPNTQVEDVFASDCLIWMLFNTANLTAGADGIRWGGEDWSLTNHFIPFREIDVCCKLPFKSTFMSDHLSSKKLSDAAQAVLDQGKVLWSAFHETQFGEKIRRKLLLNRPDSGWYQVRNALELNQNNNFTDFSKFSYCYSMLSSSIKPKLKKFGFIL